MNFDKIEHIKAVRRWRFKFAKRKATYRLDTDLATFPRVTNPGGGYPSQVRRDSAMLHSPPARPMRAAAQTKRPRYAAAVLDLSKDLDSLATATRGQPTSHALEYTPSNAPTPAVSRAAIAASTASAHESASRHDDQVVVAAVSRDELDRVHDRVTRVGNRVDRHRQILDDVDRSLGDHCRSCDDRIAKLEREVAELRGEFCPAGPWRLYARVRIRVPV